MSCANEHAPPKRNGEKRSSSKDPRPDTPDQALQNPPHLRFFAGEALQTVDSQRL